MQKIRDVTGVRAGAASVVVENGGRSAVSLSDKNSPDGTGDGAWSTLFSKSVIFLDYADWDSGAVRQVSISLGYRAGDLYRRLSEAQKIGIRGVSLGVWAIILLLVIAGSVLDHRDRGA